MLIMCRIILFSVIFFIFTTNKPAKCQIIWEEKFLTPEKGYWINEEGNLVSDMTQVDWQLDISDAIFAAEGDFAKTTATSGGRFEVLDSDGEVVFYSPWLAISTYSTVNISLKALETGSNTGTDKKYIKALYRTNDELISFNTESEASGNWGEKNLVAENIKGDSIQLAIIMNSSYANDKVIIDDIIIDGIDSTLLIPHHLVVYNLPSASFSGEETSFTASVVNHKNQIITNKQFNLDIESENISLNKTTFDQGIYHFTVTPLAEGKIPFSIRFSDEQVAPCDTFLQVFSPANVVFIDNFEGIQEKPWQNPQHWEVSKENPISGDSSLKHSAQAESSPSTIWQEINPVNLGDGFYSWSVTFKNGNWDPSSSNHFFFQILDNSFEEANGYAAGVNASGSSDRVSLWTIENGAITNLVAETDFDWNENTTGTIDITRNNTGSWTITASNRDKGETATATGVSSLYRNVKKIGFNFTFSQTRSGQLWVDDILILRENTPPAIVSAETTNNETIRVCFTEAIKTEQLTAANFQIHNDQGEQLAINNITVISPDTILLHTGGINDLQLTLSAQNIEDLEGASGDVEPITFDVPMLFAEHDLAFTEIMADPSPVIGLPEAEYLEIMNLSNRKIDTKGLKLRIKEQDYSLPSKIVGPGESVILCSIADSSLYKEFGTILGLEKFPSLLNTGTTITLVSPNETIIDQISYSDKWHGDAEKKNGGWSLEKIDPTRFCGDKFNWTASLDHSGGTPGKTNSVNSPNEDNTAPEIVHFELTAASMLTLMLSESLDTLSFDKSHFAVSGNLSVDSMQVDQDNNSITLWFNQVLQANAPYTLTITDLNDECGNTIEDEQITLLRRVISPHDIVINEILFNPRSGGSDFVELYNRSDLATDLKMLRLATRNDSLGLKSIYAISEKSVEFPAKSYLVLTKDSANISENYWVQDPELLITMKSFPAYPDDAGHVVLLNDSLEVIDEFAYTASMHNEWISSAEGVSLERLSTEAETNEPNNWYSASSVSGYATPGYKNSQKENTEPVSANLFISPDAISPNGDGFNDQMEIRFNLDKPGYMANVFVYDVNGRRVNRLMNNSLVATNDVIIFEGKYENGSQLPMGIYILVAELLHSKGEKKVFKQTFLVTDKH